MIPVSDSQEEWTHIQSRSASLQSGDLRNVAGIVFSRIKSLLLALALDPQDHPRVLAQCQGGRSAREIDNQTINNFRK
jgi:hypothetical protein